jgi:SAM-dependent methyltransferase
MTRDSISQDPYDELPYVSMPITYSQPAHLAAQAQLFGLAAPAAESASVLEIGAASGGNIIPLAMRFPTARFLGIDLAEGHVAAGRRQIERLGLTNITLAHGDIAGAKLEGMRFDYVICHGVFSWAPAAAQEAILRTCAEKLADNGVAAISFNVFPGWHARNVIRDICLEHTRDGGPPRERVAAVRSLLKLLAETAREGEPYGMILRSEAARLSARPASYILGELLAAHNEPFHVRDFIARAEARGLSYLCEADLVSSMPETVAGAAAPRVRDLANGDPTTIEQYLDIFSGRTFRRALLVRGGQKGGAPSPARLAGLHIAANLRLAGDGITDSKGRPIETPSPAVRNALAALADRYPDTVATGNDAEVMRAVFALLARGRASASTIALRTGRTDSPRPCLWKMARYDAAGRQPWISSQQHAPVLAGPALMVLAPMMDGETDRDALASALSASVRSGGLGEDQLAAGAGLDSRAAATVDQVVAYCARNALLEP